MFEPRNSLLIFSTALGCVFGWGANLYFKRMAEALAENFSTRNGSRRMAPQIAAAICGFLFLLMAWMARDASLLALGGILSFAYLLFLISCVDLITFFNNRGAYGIIPDHLNWILNLGGIGFLYWNPILQQQWWLGAMGGIGGGILMWLLRLIFEKIYKREALGLGDVKMAAGLGFFLGWQGLFYALAAGSSIGALLSLILLWRKKLSTKSALPFGPFLALGSLISLWFLL